MAQYSTLSLEELDDIVTHYEIGTSINLEELQGGYGNSNFKLTTTDGKFLLKICDEKNLEELHQQIHAFRTSAKACLSDCVPNLREKW